MNKVSNFAVGNSEKLKNKLYFKVKKNFFWPLIPNLAPVSVHHSEMFAVLLDSAVLGHFQIHKIAKSGNAKKFSHKKK